MAKEAFVIGKRKTAKARAVARAGTGKVAINGKPIEFFAPRYMNMRIMEPVIIAGEIAEKTDISVNVTGGGVSGQSDASRQAIAKALVDFSKNKTLRQKFMKYDRTMLSFDSRRNEPAKPGHASKPRSHKQKSKR